MPLQTASVLFTFWQIPYLGSNLPSFPKVDETAHSQIWFPSSQSRLLDLLRPMSPSNLPRWEGRQAMGCLVACFSSHRVLVLCVPSDPDPVCLPVHVTLGQCPPGLSRIEVTLFLHTCGTESIPVCAQISCYLQKPRALVVLSEQGDNRMVLWSERPPEDCVKA